MGELLQHVAVTRASVLTARHAPIAQRARPNEHQYPRVALSAARALQPQLLVGAADDPFEREAQRTAEAVTSMAAPRSSFGTLPIAATLASVTQRAVGKNEPPTKKDDDEKKRIQKLASASGGPEPMPAGTESRINAMQTGGEPLSASLRSSFEPRFGYDFGAVRTHSGAEAAGAAVTIGARAFTVGEHIFFGPGEFRPESPSGQRLIAHELTHTVQQQTGAARATRIQRDLRDIWNVISDPKAAALAQVTKWADELPPYELLTVLLGRNPITDRPVERSARNLLHAVLKLVPGGMAIFEDLEKNKTLEKLTAWFNAEVAKLDLTWEGIKGLFKSAWDAISLSDFVPPTKAWEKVKKIFGPPLGRLANFAVAVGSKIFEFVKKVALDKIGAWAKQQRGYTLLTFVLGKDPVTGDEVKRTAKGFVFAVLDLVPGGDKIKENLEKSKAIERTVAWLDVEIAKLDLTWEMIKGLFKKAWDAFKITDLLNPIGLLIKMAEIFGAPLGRLLRFLGAVAKKVLEFIFEGAMMIAGPIGEQIVRIVHKIGDAFNKIVDDPVAFLNNLVSAVKLGFQQFGKNIWEHLKTGLIGWLVGALEGAGIVLPKVWDLRGILDLVLQILGITYAKMRAKLVKVIGEERVALLERVFQFIKTLVTEGPAAAWQQIVEAIGSLWDMVIGGIKDWAISKIVTAAITKLATMFNPVGAIIQSIIAIYNTVAFFIERIKQILAMVEAIVDSIANIAAGKLAQAANYVEQAMARTIPVILGFLARLIGLGDVSGAIKKVITAIQEKVDKAIDAVIAWLVDKAKALFGKSADKADAGALPDAQVSKPLSMAGASHSLTAVAEGGHVRITMASGEDVLLRELAARALEDLAASPRPDEEKETDRLILLQIREWATEKDLRASYNQAGKPQPFDAWLLKYVTNIIENNLLPLSRKGIKSLQDFFAKIPPRRFLPPAYRGQWIRWNLYVTASEWSAVTGTVEPRDRRQIASAVTAANAERNPAIGASAWAALQIAPDGRRGYKIPSWATRGSYTQADVWRESLSVDHIVPVAMHWTERGGANIGDSGRKIVGSSLSNAELVTVEYNSRKQALGARYQTFVDAGFESEMASSKKMSAKIKDLSFLRAEAGEPLIGTK